MSEATDMSNITDAEILAEVLKRLISGYAQLAEQRDGHVLLIDAETGIDAQEIAAVRRAFREVGRDVD